jgi:hypothetical protein
MPATGPRAAARRTSAVPLGEVEPTRLAPAVLRAEIERTRLALGETVDVLAVRPDVLAAGPAIEALARGARAAAVSGPPRNPYTELAYRAGRSQQRLSGAIAARWPTMAAAGSVVVLLAGLTVRRRRG